MTRRAPRSPANRACRPQSIRNSTDVETHPGLRRLAERLEGVRRHERPLRVWQVPADLPQRGGRGAQQRRVLHRDGAHEFRARDRAGRGRARRAHGPGREPYGYLHRRGHEADR